MALVAMTNIFHLLCLQVSVTNNKICVKKKLSFINFTNNNNNNSNTYTQKGVLDITNIQILVRKNNDEDDFTFSFNVLF